MHLFTEGSAQGNKASQSVNGKEGLRSKPDKGRDHVTTQNGLIVDFLTGQVMGVVTSWAYRCLNKRSVFALREPCLLFLCT